jgi:hypothetical protein
LTKKDPIQTDRPVTKKVKMPSIASKHRFKLDLFLVELMGKFGITGLIIFTVVYTFLNHGTEAQYRMFIDKFILLNLSESDSFIYVFIAIIAALMFLFQNIFYRNKIKLKDQEITFLEERVKDLEKRVKK